MSKFGRKRYGRVDSRGVLPVDNGTEFHDYRPLEERFPVKIYFATPYHSWERGSNENFNGLRDSTCPRGTCMSWVTQATAITSSTT